MASSWARGSELPPPPPGLPPPLPSGPPPAYVFDASTNSMPTTRDNASEFTFRSGDGTVTFPAPRQMLIPIPPRQVSVQPRRGRAGKRGERRGDARGAKPRASYSRGRVLGAHERPLMRTRREATPERFPGMGEGHDGKFVALGELSDSDEREMEVDSSSDEEPVTGQHADIQEKDEPEQDSSITGEPPRKRLAKAAGGVPQAGDAGLPRWSNPDPYTVLPPTEEIHKKKKDVVKLIRKARLLPKKEEPKNAIANNDDFISFNFNDDEQRQSDSESLHSRSSKEVVVAGAPKGPRSSHFDRFSHRDHFRQQHIQPSGTRGALAPPPMNHASNHPLPSRPVPPSRLSGGRDISTRSGGSSRLADTWPPPDTAAALGNRKRTYDDRVKGESSQNSHRVKGKSPLPDGDIIPKWIPRAGSNPTPWCGKIDHSGTEDFGFWLHKEIRDLYEYLRPQDFEQTIRTELVEDLRDRVRDKWHDSDILSFGSFAAGLYLPDSDMDLVMVSDSYMRGRRAVYDRRSHLHLFYDFIDRRGISAPGSAEIVASAKVPLVKYVDRRTGLRVDISFENDSGLHAVPTFLSWKATFPAVAIVVPLIKHFLAMRGLNEVFTGGLGGFSVTCLVVSLLQNMPQAASGSFIAEQHLGEVLMEFLDLYGNLLNFSTTAIRVDRPGYIEKKSLSNTPYRSQEKQNRLCIIDPHNPDNDLTGGSRNIHTIRRCFSEAYSTLQGRMASLRKLDIESRKGQTLLDELYAGAYQNFDSQRERLREVFMRRDNRSPTPGPQDASLSPGFRERGISPKVVIQSKGSAKQLSLKRGVEKSGETRPKRQNKRTLSKSAMGDRSRADAFKAQYPMIEGVPTELSKSRKKILLNDWKKKISKEREKEGGNRVKKPGRGVDKRWTGSSWNELRAKAQSTAVKSMEVPRIDRFPRKAKAAHGTTAEIGGTRSDPIEVD